MDDLAGILHRFIESLGDGAALLGDRDGLRGRIKGAIADELRATQPPALMPNELGQAQPRLAGDARLRRLALVLIGLARLHTVCPPEQRRRGFASGRPT